MSSNLNEFQNATVGMTVGIIEVLILQPLNYAKNMSQQRQPISLNPAVMYRGVLPNCVNMGSCTMIQFAVGGKMKQTILQGQDRHLTLREEMTCGIVGGSVSALVGSPLELIMVQQQRKGGTVAQTVRNITHPPSTVLRGLLGCTIREALWTCGYLSIPPVVRRTLMDKYPAQFPDNNTARIPAALLGGLFACYLTHPADTIKTCMQGDIERRTYGNFAQTAAKIWADSGLLGFYRGSTFRYGRMVCAVFIMDYLREKIAFLMYPSAF